jgi:hypothetical protein
MTISKKNISNKNNYNFLINYPLERCLHQEGADAFDKLLDIVNEDFVIVSEKRLSHQQNGIQYYSYKVTCPKRNFADAYAKIGSLWVTMVLPLWQKLHQEPVKEEATTMDDFSIAEIIQNLNGLINTPVGRSFYPADVVEQVKLLNQKYFNSEKS